MRAVLLALLSVSACAAPGVPVAGLRPPVAIVAALPPTLPGFRQDGAVVDYEVTTPGLGASQRYVATEPSASGVATIYVFDRGTPRQPDGPGSPDVARELLTTAQEVEALRTAGRYRSVTPATSFGVGSRDQGPQVSCSVFGLVQPDGNPTSDAVCVTIRDGRFWKIRLTMREPRLSPPAVGVMAAQTLGRVLPPAAPRPNT